MRVRTRRVMMLAAALVAMVVLVERGSIALAAPLPDGRVIEQVSPGGTDGTPAVQQSGGNMNVLGDEAILYGGGPQPLTSTPSGTNPEFLATRGAGGWVSTQLVPPTTSPTTAYQFVDGTRNGSALVFETALSVELSPLPASDYPANQLLVRDSDGSWHTVVTDSTDPSSPSYGAGGSIFGGLSADGSQVVYSSEVTPPGEPAASYGGAPLRRVDRWTASGSSYVDQGSGDPLATCNEEVAGEADANVFSPSSDGQLSTNNVSSDGQTVFIQSGSGGGPDCPATSQVYRSSPAGTVIVSSAGGGGAPSQASTFVGATPDGGTAYFVTSSALTADDTNSGPDLYEWTAANGGAVSCVSCGTPQAGTVGNDVAVAPSGQFVYFVESGTDSNGSADNVLYVWSAGGLQEVAVAPTVGVGPYAAGNASSATNLSGNVVVYATDLGADQGATLMRAVVSPSGVAVSCVTCDTQTGEVGDGFLGGLSRSNFTSFGPVGANNLGGIGSDAISDDGNSVAFTSNQALAPNAAAGVNQVYLWEAGSGPQLIASGSSLDNEQLAEISPDGHDFFFVSPAQLTTGAPPGLTLYDARVGGGFAAPAVGVSGCSGDGCQLPPTGPTSAPPVESAGQGSGNGRARHTRAPRLSVMGLSRQDAASFARTGRIPLRIRVFGSGTVTAVATVRRSEVAIARVRLTAAASVASERVMLPLRVDRAMRRTLARVEHLTIRIAVSLPGAHTRRITLTLMRRPS